jgi:NAD(P)-dependent dehydrogenase (short-subunit alcohol dehydrogenase family)
METILITGANTGIGLELVRGFADSGRHVIACCRVPGEASDLQAVAAASDNVEVHEVHVSDGASVAALTKAIGDRPIDVLINNAGMAGPGIQHQGLAEMDYDGWAETFAVNAMAPLRVLQAFRPNLAKGTNARAVTVTSQLGRTARGLPGAKSHGSEEHDD